MLTWWSLNKKSLWKRCIPELKSVFVGNRWEEGGNESPPVCPTHSHTHTQPYQMRQISKRVLQIWFVQLKTNRIVSPVARRRTTCDYYSVAARALSASDGRVLPTKILGLITNMCDDGGGVGGVVATGEPRARIIKRLKRYLVKKMRRALSLSYCSVSRSLDCNLQRFVATNRRDWTPPPPPLGMPARILYTVCYIQRVPFSMSRPDHLGFNCRCFFFGFFLRCRGCKKNIPIVSFLGKFSIFSSLMETRF